MENIIFKNNHSNRIGMHFEANLKSVEILMNRFKKQQS